MACTAPTLTNQWEMYNAANTCAGGSACTNGAGIDAVHDSAGSDNLSQSTSANRPVYTTGSINGLAAGNWNAAASQLNRSTAPSNNTTMTWFAVIKTSALAGGPLTGNSSGSGAFEWRINSTGHQEILKGLISSIGTSTSVYSSGTWYAIMVTYNQPTGAYAFYNCTSGTCNADGSGTNGQSFGTGLDRIGFQSSDGPFNGLIAEVNYHNAISTTGYGAWSQCKYGI